MSWFVRLIAAGLLSLAATVAYSTSPAQVQAEMSGESASPANPPTPDPAARAEAMQVLGATGLLLIPESTNDRVMAFDPMTGDLIDADFIPSDSSNLSTPVHAILSNDGSSILVSDQIEDVVQEYDMDGNYIGVFAPAGGVDNSILDNIRGMARAPNGNLLVSVGSGANADAIAEFDASGNHVGNRVANGADGLDSPFDVYVRSDNLLAGGITSDTIHQYSIAGAPETAFSAINSFPEQIAEASNGNVLVGNFSGSEEGVVEYDAAGSLVDIYDPASLGGYRGVHELPNGNILTTNGSGVHEIDRSGNVVETKISGVSARFIQDLQEQGTQLPPPANVPAMGVGGLVLLVLVLAGYAAFRLRGQHG